MNSGFLFINKPVGISSYDVIRKLKKITGIKKIGHGGTLDPLASGVMIVALEKATKRLNDFIKGDKEYLAQIQLGYESLTYDSEGPLKRISEVTREINKEEIEQICNDFVGEIWQIPPPFCAKKIRGVRAYRLAREGKEVKLPAKKVMIYAIKLLAYISDGRLLNLRVRVGSGTYLRSLAHDIGEKLGCGAYLKELQRTKVGKFSIDQAIQLQKITEENWRSNLNLI